MPSGPVPDCFSIKKENVSCIASLCRRKEVRCFVQQTYSSFAETKKKEYMVQDSCFLRCCCIFQVLIFLEFSVYISCMFPMPILWVSYHSSTCCRVICFLSRPQHEKTEKKGGEGEDKSGAGPCSGAGDFALLILNLPTIQFLKPRKKKNKA